MAIVTNIFTAQEELLTLLKARMPDYEKNILPLFSDDEIINNANFSPSIFVLHFGLNQIETTNQRNAAHIEQTWGVYTVFRDARGAVKNNAIAGQVMLNAIAALQGVRLNGYTPITLSNTPRQYVIGETGAVCYPLLFKNSFVISGN